MNSNDKDITYVSRPAIYKGIKYKLRLKKTKISVFKILNNIINQHINPMHLFHNELIDIPPLVKIDETKPKTLIQYVEFEGYIFDKHQYIKNRLKIIKHNEDIVNETTKTYICDISNCSRFDDDISWLQFNNLFLYFDNIKKSRVNFEKDSEKHHIVGGIVDKASDLEFSFSSPDKIQIRNVVFKNSTLRFDWLDNIVFKNCKFENCRLVIENASWSSMNKTSFLNTFIIMDDVGGLSFNNKCTYDNFNLIFKNNYETGFGYKLPPEEFIKYQN